MRSLKPVIRYHQFQLEEKRRALGQLQGLRADFVRQAAELVTEVGVEQRAAAQSVEANWTYASYARSVIERRRNLQRSIEETERRIEAARETVADAYRELRKYELAEERSELRAAQQESRREQADLDEVAAAQQRQRGA